MDFALSAQHAEIRRSVRDFAEREIAPVADEMERRGEFPAEIIRKAAGLGLLGVPYPEEVGGTGLDSLAYAITIEELSRVSGSVGIIVSAHTSLGCAPLFLAGTAEQKERFLRPLASGAKLGAYGLTEPGAGSDSRGTRTRARRDGDAWVLGGSKRFITNAGVADVYVVFATVDPARGAEGVTAFIVEQGWKGVTPGQKEKKLGIRASHTAALALEAVEVPEANRLGAEGDGFKIAMRTFDITRSHIAAGAVGVARAAYEYALAYAHERRQFGKPIFSHQSIAFMLADMAMQIDAARLLTWRAAWLYDQGQPCATEASMAKAFAADVAMRTTTDAVQILGGYGYMREYPVEKWMRDAKIMQIYEGTAQIQRLVIARRLKA